MSANPIKAVKRATVPVYNTHICGLYTKKDIPPSDTNNDDVK